MSDTAPRGLPELIADQRARDVSRETEACETALRSLLVELGPAADGVYLIGGLTPRFLVPEPPPGIEPHMGTTDVDLVLTLAASRVAGPADSLATRLHALGFDPKPEAGNAPAFRWVRRVNETKVKLEFMCPAVTGDTLTVDPDPIPSAGDELGALRLRGAELVERDYVESELSGPTLDAGDATVRLRFANLLPFIVLKAFALDQREKDKDGYDLVWLLSAYGHGPVDAARAARESPVAREPVVERAIYLLRHRFSTPDARGPELYAAAYTPVDPVQRRGLQVYAFRTVDRFLRAWDQP